MLKKYKMKQIQRKNKDLIRKKIKIKNKQNKKQIQRKNKDLINKIITKKIITKI